MSEAELGQQFKSTVGRPSRETNGPGGWVQGLQACVYEFAKFQHRNRPTYIPAFAGQVKHLVVQVFLAATDARLPSTSTATCT